MRHHLQITAREAKRQNAAYRQHAIKCLGRICRARTDVDLSETVFQIVEPILEEVGQGEPMEVDGEKASSHKTDEV